MKSTFEERIHQFAQRHESYQQKAFWVSLFRGLTFVGAAFFAIAWFSGSPDGYLALGLALTGLFGYAVNRHSLFESKKAFYAELVRLNEEELARLDLKLAKFKTGEQYLGKDHPYQQDLDVLGQHSLFQLVNRCALPDSERLLANWLSDTPQLKEVHERQEAVKELVSQPDWNQEFSALIRLSVGKRKKEQPHVGAEDLQNWAKQPVKIPNRSVLIGTSTVLTTAMLALGAWVVFSGLPHQYLYLPLVVNSLFAAVVIKSLRPQLAGIDQAHYLVSSYQLAILKLEAATLSAPRWQEMQQRLIAAHASDAISQLTRITHLIHSRRNVFYFLLNVIFLQDAHLLFGLASWKTRHANRVADWLQTVHEAEVLLSLGSFAYANPDFVFPQVVGDEFLLEAEAVGHPLLPAGHRVTNEYYLAGAGHVDILTGSNMSGKSTFLRTLGANMVLGRLGAPVCAKALKFSLSRIFTSMRTRDNLEDNTSSFYAELKRISQLLDQLAEGQRVFFLLDEILKGTNSEDRHKGAVALAKKLTEKSAFGLISTHDLALGQLAENEAKIRNFSFNSEIIGSEIRFDYRLTPGVCRSFNASQLMRNMGII